MVVGLRKARRLEEELRKSKESARQLTRKFQSEFKRQLLTLVTAAFGFTAALFWNQAIKNTIIRFIPQAESWYWGIVVLGNRDCDFSDGDSRVLHLLSR